MTFHSHPDFSRFSLLGDLDLDIEWGKNGATY